MSLLVKSVGVAAVWFGIVGALAACGGAVEDNRCGFAGCDPGPTDPSPTTPAPTPAPTQSEPPQSSSPPPRGQRGTSPDSCPAPYHLPTEDDRCVWSCSVGTHPDPEGGIECVCQDGLKEVDTDRFGRRVCK